MNSLEKLLEDKAIIVAGLILFSKKNTILFIEECEKSRIQILGIDAFYLQKDGIQPSLDNSVDFSSSEYIQKTENIYKESIEFLKDKNEKLFFEIICLFN